MNGWRRGMGGSSGWRTALLLAAAILPAASAAAADVPSLVGVWSVDEAALRSEAAEVMASEFANLSGDARANAAAAMAAELDRIIQTAAGTIEFRPDGTAVAAGPAGPSEWVWTLSDSVVRLEKKNATVSDVALLGSVTDTAIYLEPDVTGESGIPLTLKRSP